ncbi:TetR/AcrR family transcriptional regulator [Shimia sp.]|uniref:TetR/AcrR family transcriptional regulator n=1 Tax=Shimia sp. TaxID=1954381 RepID=UPI003B8E18D1
MTHDKDAALDAALTLFWTKGYASTSLKDLERATGMHPGSLYAAFGSKAQLYCLSLERYTQAISAAREHAQETSTSVLDGLATFIEHAHPVSAGIAPLPVCFLVKATLETGQGNETIDAKLSELLNQNEMLFADIYQDAADKGELPKSSDPKRLARQLTADLAGLCFYALRAKDSSAIGGMIADLADRVRHPRLSD